MKRFISVLRELGTFAQSSIGCLPPFALAVFVLAGCATPLKLSGGLGPNANLEWGKSGETSGVLGHLLGDGGTAQLKPPPGVVIIGAGDGTSVDARVIAGRPIPPSTTTVKSEAPPGFLDSVSQWLAPKPANSQPEKP